MAALALALLLLAFSGTSNSCVLCSSNRVYTFINAKAISFSPSYMPNTVRAHCNYAVNSYFQRKGQGSCDFAGTATVTASDPSSGGTCVYPSSVRYVFVFDPPIIKLSSGLIC
ncbi:hypothetical protein JHK82_025225 [Glycine max]|nr:hypothetical protein JHK86_025344 [Glycine max]KAG5134037.1 hypothetical protein JHK82_025225 [Glycine max]